MVKYNKKLIILGVLFIISVTLALVGLTYGFFKGSVQGNENVQGTVVQTSTLMLEFVDTEFLTLENAMPGASATKTFTVENIGTGAVIYNIKMIDVLNTFVNDELVYELTSTNGGGSKIETPVPLTDTKILVASIEPGITQTYTLKVTFKDTYLNQNYNQGAEFEGKLRVDTKDPVYNKLLEDFIVLSDQSINFATTSSASNGRGLYFNFDETYGEDDTTIYYFRGDVDNNWVAFAGKLWRIVRTTSEGGIKIVYSGDGTTPGSAFISTSSTFNSSAGNKYYVGYTRNTGLDGYTGTQSPSTIKGVIDTWYTNNLAPYASYISTTAIHCADRSSEIIDGSYIYYPARDRVWTNYRPSFACSETNASRYTASGSTGNGYLTNPIALLTADEINFAGVKPGSGGQSVDSYIMDNATSVSWWTLSPSYFLGSNAYVFGVNSAGYLNSGSGVSATIGVRPAVSLKSNVMFSGGNGTFETPYIVE